MLVFMYVFPHVEMSKIDVTVMIRECEKQLEPMLKSLPQKFAQGPTKDLAFDFLQDHLRCIKNLQSIQKLDTRKPPGSITPKLTLNFAEPYSQAIKDRITQSQHDCDTAIKNMQDLCIDKMRAIKMLILSEREQQMKTNFLINLQQVAKGFAFFHHNKYNN